jgi:hypothetical protein
MSTLTKNQQVIMEYLLEHETATFDTLLDTPGAFQDGVTDEAVCKAVERINERLLSAEVPVNLSISGRRVNLARPK